MAGHGDAAGMDDRGLARRPVHRSTADAELGISEATLRRALRQGQIRSRRARRLRAVVRARHCRAAGTCRWLRQSAPHHVRHRSDGGVVAGHRCPHLRRARRRSPMSRRALCGGHEPTTLRRRGRPYPGPPARGHHRRLHGRPHHDAAAHGTRSRVLPAPQGGLRRAERVRSQAHGLTSTGLRTRARPLSAAPRRRAAARARRPRRSTGRVGARVVGAAGDSRCRAATAGAAVLDRDRRSADVPAGLRLPARSASSSSTTASTPTSATQRAAGSTTRTTAGLAA